MNQANDEIILTEAEQALVDKVYGPLDKEALERWYHSGHDLHQAVVLFGVMENLIQTRCGAVSEITTEVLDMLLVQCSVAIEQLRTAEKKLYG